MLADHEHQWVISSGGFAESGSPTPAVRRRVKTASYRRLRVHASRICNDSPRCPLGRTQASVRSHLDNGAMNTIIIESCNTRWIFDTERRRFLRVLKGSDVGPHQVTTTWRPYYGLETNPDSESFVVWLNPDRTRLLRSWRHTGDCSECGGHATAELSLDELSRA